MFRSTLKRFQAAYTPKGISGDNYTGELARTLTATATEKGFTSPYWFTSEGAEKACMTIPSDAEGFKVYGFGKPIILYNVQQAKNRRAPVFRTTDVEDGADSPTKKNSLSIHEHRLLNNKALGPSEAKVCQNAVNLLPNATPYWGTHKDFISYGYKLPPNARSYAGSLFNVCQCIHPDKVLALIKDLASNSSKQLDGTILPTALSVGLRAKMNHLRTKAAYIARIVPHETELTETLKVFERATPCYFGTMRQIESFGTSIRSDASFLASLSVLEAVTKMNLSDPLQIKSIYSGAINNPPALEELSYLISEERDEGKEGSAAYFPTDFTDHPSFFDCHLCTKAISPIHGDSIVIATPTKEPPLRLELSHQDVAALVQYRRQHHLYKSKAWVEATLAERLHIGESFISAIHGITFPPCLLGKAGVGLYNLEQLHGFDLFPDFEGEHFSSEVAIYAV